MIMDGNMNLLYDTGNLELHVGVTIYPSQDTAIDRVLSRLRDRCQAQFVILSDTSGQLVSMHGDRGLVDLVALSSLVAGDMAASQEIARITGQYQDFQLVMREGQKTCTFISEAGRYLLLFVQIPVDVPMGWARLMIIEASRQIADIITSTPESSEKFDFDISEEKITEIVNRSIDSLLEA
jgi:predicted regulator of Ras-like GTPase activity (Roadblock/LC7/MglB family)